MNKALKEEGGYASRGVPFYKVADSLFLLDDYNPYLELGDLLSAYCDGYGVGCKGCIFSSGGSCDIYSFMLEDAFTVLSILKKKVAQSG